FGRDPTTRNRVCALEIQTIELRRCLAQACGNGHVWRRDRCVYFELRGLICHIPRAASRQTGDGNRQREEGGRLRPHVRSKGRLMLALTHLLLGLAIAHVTLAIFFVIGSVAFPWCEQQDTSATPARRMLRVTCTCALGAA